MLPSIHLSLVVTPDQAEAMRHPDESPIGHIDTLPGTEGHYLEPQNHFMNITSGGSFNFTVVIKRFFRQPQSRLELFMTILLGIASFILLTYFLTVLYKCMCPRSYGKRRIDGGRRIKKQSPYYKQIRETVPLVLDSHLQVRRFRLYGLLATTSEKRLNYNFEIARVTDEYDFL